MTSQKLIPRAPQTQALTSTTFKVAPLDGSLTFPEVVDWHGVHSADHPLFIYAREDGRTRTITWSEVANAVSVGARLLQQRTNFGTEKRPVVGILAISDVLTYSMTHLSLLRANFVPFPISPRNSAVAVAHLIEQANFDFILLGREQSMQDLLDEALSILRGKTPDSSSTHIPTVLPLLTFDEILSPSPVVLAQLPELTPFVSSGPDADLVILHSSGSTAFPKLIRWTNIRCTQISLIPFFGDHDLTGKVVSLHTVPMYHAMGFNQLLWAAGCGLTISAFEPKFPATQPTPDSLFVGAKTTASDLIYCVPSVIEDWASKPDYVRWLATRSGLLFGGGPLNKATGDFMFSQGIGMFIMYAGTEMGPIGPMLPAFVDKDWEFFQFSKQIETELVPYGENAFELVIVPNDFCVPSVLNTEVKGKKAYTTSDLLEPHPTKKGYWRVFGRADDQIMHSTGEKTNPGPLESILNRDAHVTASVMFGRGKFQAGIIVEPTPECRFDVSNEVELAKYRNLIWPTVEAMNRYAPQHSRIFKEMIIVGSTSKPFTYTAKSTARRQAILNDYADEIEAAYAAAQQSEQSSIEPPAEWDLEQTPVFVRKVVENVLSANEGRIDVGSDVNLFQIGCDSLQATWIRNTILRALRDSSSTSFDARQIGEGVVYQYPTIDSLSTFLVEAARGNVDRAQDLSASQRVEAMNKMVQNYAVEELPTREVVAMNGHLDSSAVVLVTGTTGGLGSHILDVLIRNSSVKHVYALNRQSRTGEDIRKRQQRGFDQAGLDEGVSLDKVTLVAGDFVADQFGTSKDIYDAMLSGVTHIIHNESHQVFPVIAPSRPTKIHLYEFHRSFSKCVFAPETLIEAEVAVGLGYTESKWVAERMLLQTAAACPSINILIARVGQLCGASYSGAWNVKEWFPALVQASQVIGCFPTEDKPTSWIPISAAAFVLVDLTLSSANPRDSIVHLVHPQPVKFSSLADHFASAFDVPLVTYDVWLSKLEALSDGTNNVRCLQPNVNGYSSIRALQLLPYFRSLLSNADSGDAFGLPALDCSQLTSCSKDVTDSRMDKLGEEDVAKWIEYWREVGWLH